VFPELVVSAVKEPGSVDLGAVRAALERFPFQAAAKVVLGARGVPIGADVRRPLRTLTSEERGDLEAWLESSSPAPAR
jgi:dihydrodipicolinate synthase/N-acetylneuraminate lyase